MIEEGYKVYKNNLVVYEKESTYIYDDYIKFELPGSTLIKTK